MTETAIETSTAASLLRRAWEFLLDPDRFKEHAAFLIAVLALLASLGMISDSNATEGATRSTLQAVDSYAFFQAKNGRQADYEIAADDLRFTLEHAGDLDAAARQQLTQRLAFYEETIARYESEPDPSDPDNLLKGEGKVQLLAQARNYEEDAREYRRRSASYDHSTAAAQTGVVLASAAVLTGIRFLLTWSFVTCLLSAAFFFNALLGLFHIPFPSWPL